VRRRLLLALLVAASLDCAAETSPAPGVSAGGGGGGGSPPGGFGGSGGHGGDGSVCVADVAIDPAHCGSCNSPCAPGLLCENGICACGAFAPVSFSQEVEPILAANCTSGMCHVNGSGALGLELGAGRAYDTLVGVPSPQCQNERRRVVPGDAGASYLLDKLAGARLCSGKQMPGPGGLPEEQARRIVDWVCAGAPDN
jgi:hypothetical protein